MMNAHLGLPLAVVLAAIAAEVHAVEPANPAGNRTGDTVVAEADGQRARAEDLAKAASETFDAVMQGREAERIAQAQPQSVTAPAAEPQPGKAGEYRDGMLAPGWEWLDRANRDYQDLIVRRLSEGGSPFGTGMVFDVVQEWLAKANREYQQVIVKKLSDPAGVVEKRVAEEAAARKAAEERRIAEQKAAEEAAARKAADEKRIADQKRTEEDAARKADE